MKIEALAKLSVERMKYEQDERSEAERQQAREMQRLRYQTQTAFEDGQSSVTQLYDERFREYLIEGIAREMAKPLSVEVDRIAREIIANSKIAGRGGALMDMEVSTIEFTVPSYHRRYALMRNVSEFAPASRRSRLG